MREQIGPGHCNSSEREEARRDIGLCMFSVLMPTGHKWDSTDVTEEREGKPPRKETDSLDRLGRGELT